LAASGSLWGTLVGGIALGIAQQFGAHVNPEYQVLFGNILFLVVLAVRPQGLFGRRRRCREHRHHPSTAGDGLLRVRRSTHSLLYTLTGAVAIVLLLSVARDRASRVVDGSS